VLEQHDADFGKVLQQVAFFYKIPLDVENFDVGMDFS